MMTTLTHGYCAGFWRTQKRLEVTKKILGQESYAMQSPYVSVAYAVTSL